MMANDSASNYPMFLALSGVPLLGVGLAISSIFRPQVNAGACELVGTRGPEDDFDSYWCPKRPGDLAYECVRADSGRGWLCKIPCKYDGEPWDYHSSEFYQDSQ